MCIRDSDYNEWKFGVREEGTTYALHSFFRKLAQGIGPSLGLVLATKLGDVYKRQIYYRFIGKID